MLGTSPELITQYDILSKKLTQFQTHAENKYRKNKVKLPWSTKLQHEGL